MGLINSVSLEVVTESKHSEINDMWLKIVESGGKMEGMFNNAYLEQLGGGVVEGG